MWRDVGVGYAHARLMRRANREIKRLKTYLGQVVRDIGRKIATRQESAAGVSC